VNGEMQYCVTDCNVAAGQARTEVVVPEGWLRPEGTLATSTQCELICLGELLLVPSPDAGFQIPLFQRRYCWSEVQWAGLWDAVSDLVGRGEKAEHYLKRLLAIQRDNGVLEVIDGQQRLTTCCVLLASLREYCAPTFQDDINALLRPGGQGTQLILRPTLEDREAFEQAMQPESTTLEGTAALVQCRAFFSARAKAAGNADDLAHAAIDGLRLTYFPIAGSVQLQAIYEKAAETGAMLAASELMFARDCVEDEIEMEETGEDFESLSDEEVLRRYREGEAAGKSQIRGVAEAGVSMSPIDLIRNYILEHFETEETTIRIYKEHWVPIEKACSSSDVASACERIFESTLELLLTKAGVELEEEKIRDIHLAGVSGDMMDFATKVKADADRRMRIYHRFQRWWESDAAQEVGGFEARVVVFGEAALATASL